jgi:hypothetical protein
VVGALCLGTNALTSGQSGAEAVVTGAAILLMAAFAPVALFKLVPLAEASTVGHIQELSRQPFRSAERAAGSVSNVMSRAAALAGAGGLGGGVSVGAGQMLAQVSEARGPSEALDLGPGGTPKAAPAGPPARLANPPLVGAAGAADD